jgi:hypothetical protein
MEGLANVPPTKPSEHPRVGRLTTSLQAYLFAKGLVIRSSDPIALA